MCKVNCQWKTCINYDNGECKAESASFTSFDYVEENGEEKEGLNCGSYKYDRIWMNPTGREVHLKG